MKVSHKALKKIILQEAKRVLKESSGMMKYVMQVEQYEMYDEFPGFAEILDDPELDEDPEQLITAQFKKLTDYNGPARITADVVGDGWEVVFIGSKEDIVEALATFEESRGGPSVSMEEIEEEVEMNARPMSGGMY